MSNPTHQTTTTSSTSTSSFSIGGGGGFSFSGGLFGKASSHQSSSTRRIPGNNEQQQQLPTQTKPARDSRDLHKKVGDGGIGNRKRIEDVTDASDDEGEGYEEKMEGEYAKREGGA